MYVQTPTGGGGSYRPRPLLWGGEGRNRGWEEGDGDRMGGEKRAGEGEFVQLKIYLKICRRPWHY